MRKFVYIFIILCVLFIGMEIGDISSDTKSKELQDRIEDFEDQITNPDNNYKPGQDNKGINPNITNDIAKTGERAITGIFEYTLGLIESFVTR